MTSKTAALMTTAALLADPNTAKSVLTNSEHHHQLLMGVGALENGDIVQVRRTAVSKPCVAYSIPEAAKAVSLGTTKLRLEIACGRLRARKLGKRTLITAQDLQEWASHLPDFRDAAPDPAVASLKVFRAKTADSKATVAKRIAEHCPETT